MMKQLQDPILEMKRNHAETVKIISVETENINHSHQYITRLAEVLSESRVTEAGKS